MNNERGLSAYQIKVIAIIAMTIDHIAWMWVPAVTAAGQCMHTIGRITAPIMCYLLVEGYIHTHDVRKYTFRLGIFAVVSAFAFSFYENGTFFSGGVPGFGMIYTLFMALLMLRVYDSSLVDGWRKGTLMILLFMLSLLGDWAGIGVIWPFIMYVYRDNKGRKLKLLAFTAFVFAALVALETALQNPMYPYAALFQFGTLLAVPILSLYNGALGGKKTGKWFFYIYYPLHMIVIRLLAEPVKSL